MANVKAVTETLAPVYVRPSAEDRLAAAYVRLRHVERKAAAANRENEALRIEVRKLRVANTVLQASYESTETGGYRVRYEKVTELVLMARELLDPGVTGIPDATPTTLEPYVPPAWAVRHGR